MSLRSRLTASCLSLAEPSFALTDVRRQQLTFYVSLLFLRSEARRKASLHLQKVVKHAHELFMANEIQETDCRRKVEHRPVYMGVRRSLVTREQVIARARALAADVVEEVRAQKSYVMTLEAFMSKIDEKIFAGKWDCFRTGSADPFIISDAPVVTWERTHGGELSFGVGFHQPNVEVFLPISPRVCLHILPAVERNAKIVTPSVCEVTRLKRLLLVASVSRTSKAQPSTNLSKKILEGLSWASEGLRWGIETTGRQSLTSL